MRGDGPAALNFRQTTRAAAAPLQARRRNRRAPALNQKYIDDRLLKAESRAINCAIAGPIPRLRAPDGEETGEREFVASEAQYDTGEVFLFGFAVTH
jgi:hypothetical protein